MLDVFDSRLKPFHSLIIKNNFMNWRIISRIEELFHEFIEELFYEFIEELFQQFIEEIQTLKSRYFKFKI